MRCGWVVALAASACAHPSMARDRPWPAQPATRFYLIAEAEHDVVLVGGKRGLEPRVFEIVRWLCVAPSARG